MGVFPSKCGGCGNNPCTCSIYREHVPYLSPDPQFFVPSYISRSQETAQDMDKGSDGAGDPNVASVGINLAPAKNVLNMLCTGNLTSPPLTQLLLCMEGT
ncbi:hypothetical protein EMCRGX_G008745 [Ephydatia muelleri]